MGSPIKTRFPPILMTSAVNGVRYAIAGGKSIEDPPETTREDLCKYFAWEAYKAPESAPDVAEGSWTVAGSKGAQYTVSRHAGAWSCTCVGFGWRRKCRHVTATKELVETAV